MLSLTAGVLIVAGSSSCKQDLRQTPEVAPNERAAPVLVQDETQPAIRGRAQTATGAQTTPKETIIAKMSPPEVSSARADAILAREKIVDKEPRLRIGSQAPRFKVSGWLKGAPVTLTKGKVSKGKIYVIENWATWCQPCIEQMPHLSELADTFSDSHAKSNNNKTRHSVSVIAVNVEDTAIDKVQSFVDANDKDMRYPVAYDRSGYIQKQWIAKAGLKGLPASFVVDTKGRIAWVGHPEALGLVIHKLVAGQWNLPNERERAKRRRLAAPYAKRVTELLSTHPARAYQLVNVLLSTILSDQPDYLGALAYHIYAGPDVASRDLDVAYLAGALACQQTKWSDPVVIETLSKIRQQQQRMSEAIMLQRRAVLAGKGAQRFIARLRDLTKERRNTPITE